MNTLLKSTALATVFALSAQAAIAAELRIFNWSDYIDEEVIEDFTKETGIEVTYDVFDSNEILETKLLAGGSGYDIVVPSGSFLSRQIEAGVFQKLDASKLPNRKNMWPEIEANVAKYGPLNDYSINYMWGTTGIGYNVDKATEVSGEGEIVSWDTFFNPEKLAKFKDCGVHVLDAPDEIIPAAMQYLGLDPNTTNPDDFAKAEELLLSIRPYIQKFHSSEYINALANGDICLAVGWSGDVLQARDRADEADAGVSIAYSIPSEGALMWFDQMAIPKDAANVEEAHIFLDYIMRAETIAKASNYVYYANGNLASQPLLEEDLITDPGVYPTEEATKGLYIKLAYDPKTQRTATRLWTKVVTGQ